MPPVRYCSIIRDAIGQAQVAPKPAFSIYAAMAIFGSSLAKGAIKGVKEEGILGAVKGGMTAVSGGLSAAIFFGFIFALIFKSKTKES